MPQNVKLNSLRSHIGLRAIHRNEFKEPQRKNYVASVQAHFMEIKQRLDNLVHAAEVDDADDYVLPRLMTCWRRLTSPLERQQCLRPKRWTRRRIWNSTNPSCVSCTRPAGCRSESWTSWPKASSTWLTMRLL
ncbi:hypothetical protein SARC_13960, partial [Sphaeroforma arctica JP610]